jgi:hypothetical protein
VLTGLLAQGGLDESLYDLAGVEPHGTPGCAVELRR